MKSWAYLTAILFAAAGAGLKSDPDDYYLDPVEIRPVVLAEIKSCTASWAQKNARLGHINDFDIRLVEGQVPLCTIEGDVAAYIYIAYMVPGQLPKLDDIIAAGGAGAEAITEYRRREIAGEEVDPKEIFAANFPYNDNCAHAIIGVTEKWPRATYFVGVPGIILYRDEAEEAARSYLGSESVEFVGYIYCSKLNGYEFTGGDVNVVVPFDTHWSTVDSENVMTRPQIEARRGEYVQEFDPGDIQPYFDGWARELARSAKAPAGAGGNGGMRRP